MYLVTGGAGFIGSSIAEALLKKGEKVRILDDFSTGRARNVESLPGAPEVVRGSVTDPACVEKAVQGVDVIFHQAAIPSVARSVEEPQKSMMANVQGTTVLLDVARHASVKRVIFAASSSAYGNTTRLPKVETMPAVPLSPYAISKLTCEHLLTVFSSLYGIETLSLRYFNVFGPRQDPASEYAAVIPKFIMAALQNQTPVVYGDGEQTRDFCYIDNTVKANLLAASTSNKLTGQVVNVACGERSSLNQLLTLIKDIAVARGALPSEQPWGAEYRPTRAGDVRDSLADISEARRLLGYEPAVRLPEGLGHTFDARRASIE